ncbi:GNAT family N-acetyltransferase [Pseudomonas sp. DWP3-1-2]|uniref:GNAT family N-acetyltransferase n=1 Tax=Pseudomonas sp. DWP3-1-2 TaxID=2804645 RepID=UPI003CF72D3C
MSTIKKPASLDADESWNESLDDGTQVQIRPLKPEDREREAEFFRHLVRSGRFRFMSTFSPEQASLLDKLMDIDYHNRMAYVALTEENGQQIEIGVSRYGAFEGDRHCAFAVAVADDWQHRGLGRMLMGHLIEAARDQGFDCMVGMDISSNELMRKMAENHGFECHVDEQHPSQIFYKYVLGKKDKKGP